MKLRNGKLVKEDWFFDKAFPVFFVVVFVLVFVQIFLVMALIVFAIVNGYSVFEALQSGEGLRDILGRLWYGKP